MILDARLQSDSVVYFGDWPVQFDTTAGTVSGYSQDNVPVELDIDEIEAFRVERHSKYEDQRGALWLIGSLALVGMLVWLYKESMEGFGAGIEP